MAKIGLIGCGVVAEYGHVPTIQQTPGLELAAMYDPAPGAAQKLANTVPGCKAFTNEEAFFAIPMDAVVICSAAGAHKVNLFAAAKHALHVLCEKPLAMTDSDAEEMVAEMKRVGKMLFCGFVYRFSPVAIQIRDWVKEGQAGDIRSLRLVYNWDLHGQYTQDDRGEWVVSPRYHGRMLEGGPLVDCGVHQIDLARWWLGSEVTHFQGAGAWVNTYEAPDHMYLHMDHASGAHTLVETSFSFGHTAKEPIPTFTYQLIGDGGIIRYDRDGYILEVRHGQGTLRVPGASEKNFQGMYHAFAEALRTGEPGDLATGEDGVIATKIAREATLQAMSRRKVMA